MTTITFTSIEADVLRHRLCHLGELDAEDMAELFPDHEDPAQLAPRANTIAMMMKYGGESTINLDRSPDFALLLAEAVEGSTHYEVSYEAEQSGQISKQKRVAYIKALETAAAKITAATGRTITLPGGL